MRKILCSFPRQADSWHFDTLYRAGELELELVPQGTLAERIRAAGAGIGGFYTPTAFGTRLAEGKETRRIGDRDYVLEYPIHADYALIKAGSRRPLGQPRPTARRRATSRRSWRAAAKCTVVQVRETVELGALDPEAVVTPGIFVKRVVKIAAPRAERQPDEKARSQPDGRARGARHPRRLGT